MAARCPRSKRILRLDRLGLRGPSGAQDEFLLAATVQNLRKMARLIPLPPRCRPESQQAHARLIPCNFPISWAVDFFNTICAKRTLQTMTNRGMNNAIFGSGKASGCVVVLRCDLSLLPKFLARSQDAPTFGLVTATMHGMPAAKDSRLSPRGRRNSTSRHSSASGSTAPSGCRTSTDRKSGIREAGRRQDRNSLR
jgi:hypothetical protein